LLLVVPTVMIIIGSQVLGMRVQCTQRRLVMSRDLFRQLHATAFAAHPDGPVRDLSKSTIKASTNSKRCPDHTAIVSFGLNRLRRGSGRKIGSPVKWTGTITCRPNLPVRNSLTPSILDSRASCGRRDKQRN
jgi:hypothetical protein